MPEIAKFPSRRVWRRPLLDSPKEFDRQKKLLRVSKDDLEGIVIFEKQSDVWVVANVPSFITYCRGMLAKDFKHEIEAQGFTWEWA